MHMLAFILSAPFIEVAALFLAIIWMIRDQKDKVRLLLVIALTVNLFYGMLLRIFMGAEGSLLPWKYDIILLRLDEALGVSTGAFARVLQGTWRVPLATIYELMVPMMICWFLVTRRRGRGGALILAYVAELGTGPVLYAIVPACGPVYALGPGWMHSAAPKPELIRLAGMPNAFPSLHIATAVVLLMFAPGRWSRAVAVAFLAATVMATISTGEHYVIDWVPALAFGCYAVEMGFKRWRWALPQLGIAVFWSLVVRFRYEWLISHPVVLRSLVAATILAVVLQGARKRIADTTPAKAAENGDPAPEQPPPLHSARP